MITNVIAIAGPSGSGKSFLAEALQLALQTSFPSLQTAILAEDSYYRDQSNVPMAQREQVNYDHPSALEHDLLLSHLRDLKAGSSVAIPTYDYAQHTRSDELRELQPTQLLIVEGILLLSHVHLRQEFDLRLFVDTPLDVCLERRMQRDCVERGRSEESVKQQFETTVLPMFHEHIAPTRDHAHIVLSGEDSPQSLTERVQQELQHRGYVAE